MSRNINRQSDQQRRRAFAASDGTMSEGYTVEDRQGEIIGIVVRKENGRGFRFFSSVRAFDALDGHIFATAQAAQRAVRDIERDGKRAWRAVPSVDQHRLESVPWDG